MRASRTRAKTATNRRSSCSRLSAAERAPMKRTSSTSRAAVPAWGGGAGEMAMWGRVGQPKWHGPRRPRNSFNDRETSARLRRLIEPEQARAAPRTVDEHLASHALADDQPGRLERLEVVSHGAGSEMQAARDRSRVAGPVEHPQDRRALRPDQRLQR